MWRRTSLLHVQLGCRRIDRARGTSGRSMGSAKSSGPPSSGAFRVVEHQVNVGTAGLVGASIDSANRTKLIVARGLVREVRAVPLSTLRNSAEIRESSAVGAWLVELVRGEFRSAGGRIEIDLSPLSGKTLVLPVLVVHVTDRSSTEYRGHLSGLGSTPTRERYMFTFTPSPPAGFIHVRIALTSNDPSIGELGQHQFVVRL